MQADMTDIKENFPLRQYNTMGINVNARFFAKARTIEELKWVLDNHRDYFPFYIIGGGSNILFTKDFNGLILQPAIKGITILEENRENLVIEAGAGEDWDAFVQWTVDRGLGGIENLSYIPGSVGSSPIQNIGAYGAEVREVIDRVNYLDLKTSEIVSLPNRDCNFGYRDSIFKNLLKNRVIITSVVFRLNRFPVFNTSYDNLMAECEKHGSISLEKVRNAVIEIRKSKLPDPAELGNAGSFFKNPVVESILAEDIRKEFREMPSFPVNEDLTKIPAGWLIEQCGWKGKRKGNAGVHEKQALVIVNYGNATGTEVLELAENIRQSVFSKFSIQLETEVNII
jgi:UDP-N-acetylmuramate dehydrogenase